MRAVLTILLLLSAAACKKQQTFDDRYKAAARQIEQRAANLDAEMNRVEANDTANEQARAPEER